MKKIEKLKNEKDKRKTFLFITTLFIAIGIFFVGASYAIYQKEAEVTFINARVGKFVANDIELAMKVDGKEVSAPPSKNSLYQVEVNCDNATGTWDKDKWGAIVTNISTGKVKCEVNFVTPSATITNVTAASDKTTINLSYTASGIGTTTTCVYGKTNSYGSTASGTTNTKCSMSGLSMDTTYYYKVCAKNATGEVCKEGSIKTKPNSTPFTQSDVGKYVSMTPTATSYTPPSSITGCLNDSNCTQNTLNPSELNLWRVIKVNSDGTIEMVSDKVSSTLVYFRGDKGYMNLVGGLNTIAAQYTDGKHVLRTRHMGYSTQKEKCSGPLLYQNPGDCGSDTGYQTDTNLVKSVVGSLEANKAGTSTASTYWLASRYFYGYVSYYGRYVSTSGSVTDNYLYNVYSDGTNGPYSKQYAVRPIVTLKSTSDKLSGSGTSSSPYILN